MDIWIKTFHRLTNAIGLTIGKKGPLQLNIKFTYFLGRAYICMHPSLDAVFACVYGTQSDIGNFLHTWNIENSCEIEITLIRIHVFLYLHL